MEIEEKKFIRSFVFYQYFLENKIRQKVREIIRLNKNLINKEFINQNFKDLLSNFKYSFYEEKIEQYRIKGIHFLTFLDEEFPIESSFLSNFPISLFYIGSNFNQLNKLTKIAIVGSRNSDDEGEDIAFSISKILSNTNISVISGLAIGIDGASHRGSICGIAQIPTVAVLGSGLLNIYPSSHKLLAEEIVLKGGILISEFLPEEKPYPSNFSTKKCNNCCS